MGCASDRHFASLALFLAAAEPLQKSQSQRQASRKFSATALVRPGYFPGEPGSARGGEAGVQRSAQGRTGSLRACDANAAPCLVTQSLSMQVTHWRRWKSLWAFGRKGR